MLGSLRLAKNLVLCVATGIDPIKVGFEHVGSGAYRDAYVGPDGNVYKVDRNHGAGKKMTGYNYSEWVGVCEQMNAFPVPLSDGRVARLAQSQMFEVGTWYIMCQEYVPNGSGWDPLQNIDYRRVQDWFGISDLHNDNYRIDDEGNVVIVDAGFNSDHVGTVGRYETCACGNEHWCEADHNKDAKESVADQMMVQWFAAAVRI